MPNPSHVPIIGSGFGDVGNQIQSWAGFNRSVDEANLARESNAETQRRNYFLSMAQQQREQEDRDLQLALSERNRSQDLGFRETEARRRDYEFGKTLELEKSKVDATRGAALDRSDAAFGKINQAARIAELKLAGQNATDTGMYDDAAHVKRLHPNLTTEDAEQISQLSQQSRHEIAADWQQDKQFADLLNKRKSVDAEIKKTIATKGQMHWWNGTTDINQKITDLRSELSKLDNTIGSINASDKKRVGRLTAGDDGLYAPPPMPAWGASVGQQAPAASAPRYSFGQSPAGAAAPVATVAQPMVTGTNGPALLIDKNGNVVKVPAEKVEWARQNGYSLPSD